MEPKQEIAARKVRNAYIWKRWSKDKDTPKMIGHDVGLQPTTVREIIHRKLESLGKDRPLPSFRRRSR